MTLQLTLEIDGPTAKRLQQIAERSRLADGGQPELEDVAADALAQWSEQTVRQLAVAAEDADAGAGQGQVRAADAAPDPPSDDG